MEVPGDSLSFHVVLVVVLFAGAFADTGNVLILVDVAGDGDVGGAFFEQAQQRRQHSTDGPDFPALGIACRRHRVVVPE